MPPRRHHAGRRQGPVDSFSGGTLTVSENPRRFDLPSLPMLALAVVAFALRVNGLGSQSLWHDEGASLFYASLPPAQAVDMVAALGEIPPLYYVLLHYWIALAGTSEFALRFPSVGAGLLGVVLLYRLGSHLGGNTVGLTAAVFLALSPIHLWQSQETRMYAFVVALSVLSAYLCVRAFARPSLGLLAAYALVGVAGLYTHFTFALVLLAEGVALALWLPFARGRRGTVVRVGLAAILSAATFLPWLAVGLTTYASGSTYFTGKLNVFTAGRDTLAAFVQGEHARPVDPTTLAVLALALAVLGLLAATFTRRGEARFHSLLVGCYLVVPAAALFGLLLDRPKFGPRYLMVALPAFCLLAGYAAAVIPAWFAGRRLTADRSRPVVSDDGAVAMRVQAVARSGSSVPRLGLGAVGGVAGLGLALACLWANVTAVQAQFTDPEYAREDFRGAAGYLAEQTTSEDAIILLGGHIQLPFKHYYEDADGKAPVFPLPDVLAPPVTKPLQYEDLAVLNNIVPGRKRVWVVRWQDELADPAGMVLRQLELSGRRVDPGRAFHGLLLESFDVLGSPRFPVVFQPRVPVGAAFANGLTLLGYDLTPEQAKPGDTLRLTVYWRAESRIAGDLVAFTQLLNAGDHIYAQHDKPPVSDLYKTSQWAAGDLLKDEYQLRIHPGSPPGTYRLLIGLYDRENMRRVDVRARPEAQAGNSLTLAEIALAAAPAGGAAAAGLAQPLSLDLAPGMRLLGYQVEQQELHPGDTARVALTWLATGPVDGDRQVYLVMRAPDGGEPTRSLAPPADGTYPTPKWRPDDLVRDVQSLKIPPDLRSGKYDLYVAAPVTGADPGAAQRLGSVEVK
ncbi:MAG: glycosyltransferase family 39 protein [Chloroflexota bacterium]